MDKERLSRLQKWILVRAYALGGTLPSKDIWEKFFHLRCCWNNRVFAGFTIIGDAVGSAMGDPGNRNKATILSRSKRKLEEKGYIQREWIYDKELRDDIPTVVLTDKGKAKAEELLRSEPVDRL